MPFYRFEQFESRLLTPHLSSGAAAVLCTSWLEHRIDSMTPEEQARARVERKAN